MLVMMTSPTVFSTIGYRQKQKKNSYIWLHTNSYGWMTR